MRASSKSAPIDGHRSYAVLDYDGGGDTFLLA